VEGFEMTELTKIVIDLEEQKIELTPEQAKELKEILNDLFGEKVVTKEIVERIIERPRRYWYYEWYPNGTYKPWGTSVSYNDNVTSEKSNVLSFSLNKK
jgi:hypothetical protein